MRKLFYLALSLVTFASCNNSENKSSANEAGKEDNKDLAALFENYYQERMQLLPLESTQNGDSANNDKIYPDFTDSYRAKLKEFFDRELKEIGKYDREKLSDNDRISYDIFKREMEISLDG